MKKSILLLGILLLAIPASVRSANDIVSVESPDGNAVLSLRMAEGGLVYDVTYVGQCLLRDSRIGYETSAGTVPGKDWSVTAEKSVRHRGVWHPVWGKRSAVADNYREANVTFSNGEASLRIVMRAYNDGVAFRYLQTGESWCEATDFGFAGDYTAWYYNGERHNLGPELLSQANGDRTPIMTIKADDDIYMAVHEAMLNTGKPLLLHSEAGDTRFSIVSAPVAAEGDASAWRVIMLGRKPGDLVDSHLIELLNPDYTEDAEYQTEYSWVKPGIYLWDWRINGAVWEGYRYTMNYESWTRMIDFAAENGFAGLVLDANWYGPEFEKDSDPTTGDKARDVQRIIKYGKERGVGVWLYLNDVAGSNYPIEATLAQYEEWGASGVKYGFMNGSDIEKNQKTINITRLCAKHHLMVDFHDYPVHPWGQDRTYPNAVTREYCKAQLDGRSIFYPKTFVTSVFVNMVAGPVDMNNGMFDLRQGRTTRVDNNQEVPSTVAAEAARTMITYSGATVIPDIPEYYRKYPSLLQFLGGQRQPWLESRTLDGVIGEYIVMMRQANDGRYLIGAATNEDARKVSVDLSFLPKGKFTAVITEDAPDADYRTNREVIQTRTITVDRKSVLELSMAPGGGACVLISKE